MHEHRFGLESFVPATGWYLVFGSSLWLWPYHSELNYSFFFLFLCEFVFDDCFTLNLICNLWLFCICRAEDFSFMGVHQHAWGEVGIEIFSPRSKHIAMVNKISPWDEQEKMALRSNGALVKSLSFKEWEGGEQTKKSSVNHKNRPSRINVVVDNRRNSDIFMAESSPIVSSSPKCELDAAAVKVQKVYKSYRTRRNLADCAVVVEELWYTSSSSVNLEH